MAFLSSINIVASGMTAQQLRLDVVSENITNSTTTRTEGGDGAYRRKMVVFQSVSDKDTFRQAMARAGSGMAANKGFENAGGVRVTQIVDDPSPMKLVYDPTHPDANEDTVKEITDAMAATQAFSANVTAFNALKSVLSSGLEIGR